MAPQTSIPLAATVLGTIGTVCWSIQLIPQVWTNWKTKSTEGLPGATMLLWAASAVPFGTYAIAQNFNIPVQIQPHVFCALAMVNYAQILRYGSGWRIWTSILTSLTITLAFAALEALLIMLFRGPTQAGNGTPMLVIGIIASVLVAAGLLPPWWEIYKRGGQVVGISFIFLTVDLCGALFSLLALVAQHTFDVLGGVLYIICLFLEGGIFVSHGIWLLRTRSSRMKRIEEASATNEKDMIPVEIIPTKNYKAAAACLAEAFADDDVAAYFFDCPDTLAWTSEQKWNLHTSIMEYLVYAHIMNGHVVGIRSEDKTNGNCSYDAVALWCPPFTDIDSKWTYYRSGMWRLNSKLSEEGKQRWFVEFMPLLHQTKHDVLGKDDSDSFYLVYLGTREAARGKGYARRLVEWGTKQADQLEVPTYLESSNVTNVPLYRKFGFEVMKNITLTRSAREVSLDIMVRDSRTIKA